MTKLAILYTGLPDNFEENSKTHKILFDNFDTDVYISTWDHISLKDNILKFIPSKNVVSTTSNFNLISERITYNINKTLANTEIHFDALHGCMLGYYHMDMAYKSISFPEYYDIIIRLRFDILFHENALNCDTIKEDSKNYNTVYGWRDRFNYGHPTAMKIASTIFSTSATGWYIGPSRRNIEILWGDHFNHNSINLVENFRQFTIKKSESDQRNQTLHS